ncbi:MAG TPA: hypothetical protein ENN39_12250 [Desulfonatronum sp.]|nr:hypothetical protein [Desulfonatronum sp.]
MTSKTLLCLFFLLILLPACSTKFFGSSAEEQPVQETQKTESSSYYYDFDDILVPRDMKLQPKLSFVFEGPHVKAGVLVFKGRVDSVSLSNYFINNMLKDGWQLSSSFKYRRTILVFTKPDRDCIINIIDDRLSTSLEIWIAPKEGGAVTSPSRLERTLTQ